MDRFDEKRDLMLDYCHLVAELNRYQLPKQMQRRFYREMNSDINKGLKDINKKIPVGIEIPKREPVGNGMYRECYSDEENTDVRDVVVCSSPGEVAITEDNQIIVNEQEEIVEY